MSELEFVVEAVVGASPIRRPDGERVTPETIGLTKRLLVGFADWSAFFDDIDGDLSDPDVAGEFVGQAFKLAHKLRGELKGSTVHLVHPATGELIEIIRTAAR